MTAKLNKLRHATAERLRNPHFAFMRDPDVGNISNTTNGTNTTGSSSTGSGDKGLWERFVNWMEIF